MSTPRRRKQNQHNKLQKDAPESVPRPKAAYHEAQPGSRKLGLLLVFASLIAGVYFYYRTLLFESSIERVIESPWPFKVVNIPGKGHGAIATRNISQGELIHREAPLFTLPLQITAGGSPGSVILHALAKLSPSQRAAFYNLSYVNLPPNLEPGTSAYNDELALAIFQTNSISAGDQGVGLFPQTARLNHGCAGAFNAVYTYRPREAVVVVHALKPVKEGEEVLTTYFDTKRPRDARRAHLEAHYGFTCQCSVCSLPDEASAASDRRLTRMTGLYAQFATWQDGSLTGKQALDVAREIWSVGEEEGYWSERGQLAADAAWVAAAHADSQAARAWAEVAKEWYAYELGPDSEQVSSMEEVIANPESLRRRMPATRAAEKVGWPDGWLG